VSIDYLDRKVSSFVETVQERTENETTFIVTADHGENLAYPEEDNLFNHASSLSEGVLHVPLLILNSPGNKKATIDNYVSHVDIPTLVDGLTTNEIPDITRPRIAAELIGGTHRIRDAATQCEELAYWDRTQRCVYNGTDKYHWDSLGNSRLLEINAERPSWQQVIEEEIMTPDWAEYLFNTDAETHDQSSTEGSDDPFNASVESRLSDLGYM